MFLYLWFQASRYGWKFAAGFVVLLFLHEMGHAVAIRKYGLKAGWPLFIPGFGALISMKEPAPSRGIDAEISFGGPLWGTIASFAVAGVTAITAGLLFWETAKRMPKEERVSVLLGSGGLLVRGGF